MSFRETAQIDAVEKPAPFFSGRKVLMYVCVCVCAAKAPELCCNEFHITFKSLIATPARTEDKQRKSDPQISTSPLAHNEAIEEN